MNQAAQTGFRSVFDQVWDIVVVGSGYGGYAAATTLHRQGKRVLLVGREAAILYESGWSFTTCVGRSDAPEWQAFTAQLQAGGALNADLVDGAIAEVTATLALQRDAVPTLYYAAPVAAWRNGSGDLGAVAVATKAGVRTLVARAWIDATETGELLALLDAAFRPGSPTSQEVNLYLRHAEDARSPAAEITAGDLPGATLAWRPTQWPNERVLSITLAGETAWHRAAWLPALKALRQQQGDAAGAVVTHASVVPFSTYAAAHTPPADLPRNVGIAVPSASSQAVRTLSDRFELGLRAAGVLHAAPSTPISSPPADFAQVINPSREISATVAVAGMGTGGAVAAIAAARAGADVFAFDPLPFAGGIGTGGGIHSYYFGVKGGMQEEIDQRTREIMPLFGQTRQIASFHPDAKKLVLEQMMRDAGVRVHFGASLWNAQSIDGRVVHADLSTPTGPARLRARAWIDGTGDADLAATAGARFILGRTGDGQMHAYSQSAGRAEVAAANVSDASGEPPTFARLRMVNFDAGFVDPTDSEDLTRGRLVGIAQYAQEQFTPINRPTYIAPAIGLRQARQIVTDYVVTLADLLERRRFDDAVGLTGAHYDNHSIDYEFESDEGMFWVWCCRQWRAGRTACEMPYRMMLPRGLDNLLVASRGAGISEEAHHSLRMQRDFQRLGEAAGYAAALMVADGREHASTRQVPYAALRQRLEATGSLAAPTVGDHFGSASEIPIAPLDGGDAVDQRIAQWVEEVRAGFSPAMYFLMRRPGQARVHVEPLLSSPDSGQSWRAATILAMGQDPVAEARLIQAVRSREYGFDDAPDDARPETNNRLAPHWIVAVALLRRCGTLDCLEVLCPLAADPLLPHNARNALALTLATLAAKFELSAQQKNAVAEALRQILATPVPNARGNPQRKVVPSDGPAAAPQPDQRKPVVEDFGWQTHLAVARAEHALGLPVHEAAWAYLDDPRATVRRAFTRLLQPF